MCDSRIGAPVAILFRLLRVLVELTGIADAALDGRHVRRVNVLARQTFPGHLGKPWVVHHVLGPAVQVPQALGQVRRDQALEEVLCIRVDVRRVLDPAFQDVLIDLHGRATVPEWREAAQHLENQDTQRPPW